MNTKARSAIAFVGIVTALSFAGCMFDVVQVHQSPAKFAALGTETARFRLTEQVIASIGTGFTTHLNANTVWREIGRIEAGVVFATSDQVITVEASNIYEARIVVADHALVGFYLPVEKTFVTVSPSMPLKTIPVQQNE